MSLRNASPTASSRVSLDRSDRNDPSFSTPTTPVPRSHTKSTPRALTVKPPPFRSRVKNQTEDDISVQPVSQPKDQILDTFDDPFLIPAAELRKESPCPKSHLENLPPEILEGIIGHVVGHLGSTTSDPSGSQHSIRNWNTIMRHPRRKKVADLALVSYTWRRMIQERVYRHIKIQGTRLALQECGDWFLENPHLQGYVRHFEVLIPIWEMRPGWFQPRFAVEQRSDGGGHTLLRAFQGLAVSTNHQGDIQEATTVFQLASRNATMEEIFGCAQVLFPGLCALTIEGGHCKRPPKVQYFREMSNKRPLNPVQGQADEPSPPSEHKPYASNILTFPMPGFRQLQSRHISQQADISHPCFPSPLPSGAVTQLPTLPQAKTLILKGAWNIIRAPADFAILARALPSLREFHCTYHKPKTMAYAVMCESLALNFSSTITHLNLCLEGLYMKNASSLKKWRKLYPARHICRNLGAVAPRLESLTYTGRVCGTLFSTALNAAEQTRQSCTRLKAIDIVVNNVCRDPNTHHDGTGIYNWPFIQAFEALVIHAVRSLQAYTAVQSMRIRFIDLDSPAPLLNPMFHLEGNRAWGIYSDEILRNLNESRPNVQFGNLPGESGYDGPLGLQGQPIHRCDLAGKHKAVSVAYYKAMTHAGGLV